MSCTAPIWTGAETRRLARCGQCRQCRILRKLHWVGRMRLELKDAGTGRFVTLTYADPPPRLYVDDLQRFLKRYRKHYGKCRYFAVGEYGDKYGRPHWHLIIFGHPQQAIGKWHDNKAWNLGFSYDGSVTPESIAYVAGYTLKWRLNETRPMFTRMSLRPGLGYTRLAEMGERFAQIYKNSPPEHLPRQYKIGGKNYPLIDGALQAFKRAYLNSGGLPPVSETPLDGVAQQLYLQDFGGFRSSEQMKFRNWHEREASNAPKAQTFKRKF